MNDLTTGPRRFINTREFATRYGISESTANKARITGAGCPFYKVGSRVVYDVTECDAWMNSKRRVSTSDEGGVA
jgi:hypothetical protein